MPDCNLINNINELCFLASFIHSYSTQNVKNNPCLNLNSITSISFRYIFFNRGITFAALTRMHPKNGPVIKMYMGSVLISWWSCIGLLCKHTHAVELTFDQRLTQS